MHARALLLAIALAAPTFVAASSCRTATEITIVVTTDVPCSHVRGSAITVGRLGANGGIEDRPAAATGVRCDAAGNLGVLVVTPSGGASDEVAFKLVVGVDRNVEDCVPPYGKGCIVARRALEFIPHTGLTVPVAMRASCDGIPCDPTTTCVVGQCVRAKIPDASACAASGGCSESVLIGGGGDAGAPSDAGDAASSRDAGDVDAAVPVVAGCGDLSGLQTGSPWPMDGYCPSKRRRSPFSGPQAQPPPGIKWTFPAAAIPQFSPLIAADGTIYLTSDDNTLYAVNPVDGREAWHFTAAAKLEWMPAIGVNGLVYVSAADATYAVDPKTHQPHWSSPSVARGNLVVSGASGGLIFFADASSSLVALDTNGGFQWALPLGAPVDYLSPVIATNGKILMTVTNGNLWTIASGGTGSPVAIAGASGILRLGIAPDDSLRLGSDNGQSIQRLTTGAAITWTYAVDGGGAVPHPFAIGDDGTTYVAFAAGPLVAIDANGGKKWTASNAFACNAVTLGADGVVYSGCSDGVSAFDAASGARLWNVPMNPSGMTYSLSIGRDHRLYVSASDGKLYSIGN